MELTPWREEFKESLNLEILQFPPNDTAAYEGFDSKMGKGFNEYLMIKKGVHSSTVMKDCAHFLKITGCYSMLNIRTMIREIEKRGTDKVFFGDIKDTRIYDWIGRKNTCSDHWGDSRFFVVEIDFYKKEMLDCYKEMCDYEWGKWAEDYLLRLSRKYRKDPRFLFRFRHQVQFNGVSGTKTSEQLKAGIQGDDSSYNRLRNFVRYMLRNLFPNIWF